MWPKLESEYFTNSSPTCRFTPNTKEYSTWLFYHSINYYKSYYGFWEVITMFADSFKCWFSGRKFWKKLHVTHTFFPQSLLVETTTMGNITFVMFPSLRHLFLYLCFRPPWNCSTSYLSSKRRTRNLPLDNHLTGRRCCWCEFQVSHVNNHGVHSSLII